MAASGRRGSYPKGVAKREEILRTALDVVAREGYHGTSVRHIADAVGLSQAGLLHYFDSKQELFTEILRKRDEVDAENFRCGSDFDGVRRGYLSTIRHNTEVAGLVQLFSHLSVAAADPGHRAHEFFLERSRRLRQLLAQAVRTAQEEGRLSDRIAPETLARVLLALSDGLQLQWLLDPDVDMAGIVDAVLRALTPEEIDHDPSE